MAHKAGYVNIIGNPNVGKSTLMNALVGAKLSIITSKAQTTRHRILGIVNGEDFQIVYSDTPGILSPKYKLQESMMSYVNMAFSDADVILYVADIKEPFENNEHNIEKLLGLEVPVILALNKIDLSNQVELEELVEKWGKALPGAMIVPVAARNSFNIQNILNLILEKLPESPAYFPKDQLTDRFERFFVSEIIREKILLHYKKEIPYSVEVEVESYKEETHINRIAVNIHVTRESQKGILIGHNGNMLKRVGTEARKDIEDFLDKKVFLEMRVKVSKEWRDKPGMLKQFGY